MGEKKHISKIAVISLVFILSICTICGCSSSDKQNEIIVPDVIGMTLDKAESDMDDVNLDTKSESDNGKLVLDRSNWTVIKQEPAAGTAVQKKSKIVLTVSKDKNAIEKAIAGKNGNANQNTSMLNAALPEQESQHSFAVESVEGSFNGNQAVITIKGSLENKDGSSAWSVRPAFDVLDQDGTVMGPVSAAQIYTVKSAYDMFEISFELSSIDLGRFTTIRQTGDLANIDSRTEEDVIEWKCMESKQAARRAWDSAKQVQPPTPEPASEPEPAVQESVPIAEPVPAPAPEPEPEPASEPEPVAEPAPEPAPAAAPEPAPSPASIGYTVYVTDTGKKYHAAGCRYLKESQHPISLEDAQSQGYTPCSHCNP